MTTATTALRSRLNSTKGSLEALFRFGVARLAMRIALSPYAGCDPTARTIYLSVASQTGALDHNQSGNYSTLVLLVARHF